MDEEKSGENSGLLTSLPVDRLNGDRLQRRPLVPIMLSVDLQINITMILCRTNKGESHNIPVRLAPTPACQPSFNLASIATLDHGYYCI